VTALEDWKQGSLLSVESDRLQRWYKPGLLLIGDAAHVSSPVGGVGINLAIQDAVIAANVLSGPLKEGKVRTPHLAAVQRRREWVVRLLQGAQNLAQRCVVAKVLEGNRSFELPRLLRLLLRVPMLRAVPARLIAYGAGTVRFEAPKR
jgi:2-polyprenyl-6-methoxyphenol hydroxylase-like FAD-dependent oxidoreductase